MLTLVGRARDGALEELLEEVGQVLPVGIVEEDHADVVVALVAREIGEDHRLRFVGEGTTEQEAVVVGNRDAGAGG